MATAADAHGLIGSCTHNGTAVAVVKTINGHDIVSFLKLRNQGKIGPGKLGLVGRDCQVVLGFYGGKPAAVGTKGDLVVTPIKVDAAGGGAGEPFTWLNMVAGSNTFMATHGEGNSEWTQEFNVEDDLDTTNLSY